MNGWLIGLHLLTAHASSGYESVTPGLYARHESGFTLGAYRNSLGRNSAYAGWTLEEGRWAITLGAVTGYQRKCHTETRNNPDGSYSTVPTCSGHARGAISGLLAPSVKLGDVRLALVAFKRPAVHLAWEW